MDERPKAKVDLDARPARQRVHPIHPGITEEELKANLRDYLFAKRQIAELQMMARMSCEVMRRRGISYADIDQHSTIHWPAPYVPKLVYTGGALGGWSEEEVKARYGWSRVPGAAEPNDLFDTKTLQKSATGRGRRPVKTESLLATVASPTRTSQQLKGFEGQETKNKKEKKKDLPLSSRSRSNSSYLYGVPFCDVVNFSGNVVKISSDKATISSDVGPRRGSSMWLFEVVSISSDVSSTSAMSRNNASSTPSSRAP